MQAAEYKTNSLFIAMNKDNARKASKSIVDLILNNIWPLILTVKKQLEVLSNDEDNGKPLWDMFSLCCSQIQKSVTSLFDVYKLEHQKKVVLSETRHCATERLAWCIQKLNKIKKIGDQIEKDSDSNLNETDDSLLLKPMYFVNWIDHTFDVLSKLAELVYKTDHKENPELNEKWEGELVECISDLHVALDELLLSAMTLWKYCLPSDQHIVKARSQVVLRETKSLLTELINEDLNTNYKVTRNSLKLPIKAQNVNILIDVLKDVLYALETNTNTALLALLVHCFSNTVSPVDILKNHFENSKGSCKCGDNDIDESKSCPFVKEFDMYNERLLQIGSFAVSCSSDQKRILSLRSGLASLEALDPHLVPAVMMSPNNHHAILMMTSWRQEVNEIRDSVFLIVDPAAFSEKCQQLMHVKLLELLKRNCFNNLEVNAVINIGCVLHEFFLVYYEKEPDALANLDTLVSLMDNLKKVQMECKIVSNIMSAENEVKYAIKMPMSKKEASFEKLSKRLKLLYTLVNKINRLFHPKDNEDQLFVDEICEEIAAAKNITHIITKPQNVTYINTNKNFDASRSMFVRSTQRASINNHALSKLTKHLKIKRGDDISFSVQLDELLNEENVEKCTPKVPVDKRLSSLREPSILYNYSPKTDRSSLRKAVLKRNFKPAFEMGLDKAEVVIKNGSLSSGDEELMDDNTSLQITEILDQMTEMSKMFVTNIPLDTTHTTIPQNRSGVIRSNLNKANESYTKYILNIPVNASTGVCFDETCGKNVSDTSSQPSNISTLERINDLDLVECKLSNLRYLDQETAL